MVRGEGGDRKGERDSRASAVCVEVGSSAAGLGAQGTGQGSCEDALRQVCTLG